MVDIYANESYELEANILNKIFIDCRCGWYWKLLGFGAFAYYYGVGCVIVKVFVARNDCDGRSGCEGEEDRKGGDE